ncbi:zf-RING_2 domain-containing protein [Cephalotus follicularis]|uniref:RING-type E3 ubiquitin transferase n=1 Tax=Cephalotus follicularis TaxID=3775 RepID=A0A1Q3D5D4_CEPFO|nr:zf-RING_2 domain-containing protein [Cephalotus follicularis]
MKDHMEFMGDIANSIATATRICSNTIVITIIIFMVRSCAKKCWRNYHFASFTYHHKYNSKDDETPFCTVCLYEVKAGERVRQLPKCKHCYHVECIDAWFQSRSTCPICRKEVSHLAHRSKNQNGKRKKREVASYQYKIFWYAHLYISRSVVSIDCNSIPHQPKCWWRLLIGEKGRASKRGCKHFVC